MIKINDRNISSVYSGEKVIEKIYKGALLVWEGFKNLLLSGIPPLTLPKCKGVDLVDYKIYGESVQESKNLFNINDINASSANHIINNNTISVLSAGTGTYRQVTYKKIPVKASTEYYLSFQDEVVGSGKTRISVYQYDENNTFITDKPFYSSGVLETRNNAKYIEVRVYANEATVIPAGEGVIYSNIQIEKGNVATAYEPYQTPTPETPMEIQSVGEKTRNLVNIPTTALTTSNKTIAVDLPSGKVYTLSAKIESNGVTGRIRFIYNLNGTDVYSQNAWKANDISIASGFEIPEGATDIRVLLQRGTNFEGTFSEIMVVEGTYTVENLPDYEPYGYKIPVKARGKNLFKSTGNVVGTLVISDGSIYSSYKWGTTTDFIPLKAGAYIINYKSGINLRNVALFNENKEIVGNFWSNRANPYKFTLDKDYLVRIDFERAGNVDIENLETFFTEYQVQLEQGTIVTDYEPYVEPVTTNIYLDEPLRKIGDYADYIEKEIKIIDGKEVITQKVVRKIVKLEMNGTEDLQSITGANYHSYNFIRLGFSGLVIDNMCFSTHFQLQEDFSYTKAGNNKCRTYNSSANNQSRIAFRLYLDNKIVYDITTVKSFLTTECENGTPITFYYAVADGLETEETINLPNIPTHKGTTILEIDAEIQPSNMEVVYKGKSA